MNSWLVLQTRPRWEKKFSLLLAEKGFEVFCPLQNVKRQWSDRIKLIQQPVFPLYVFVKISENERTTVRLTPGVVNFVVKERKPVVIREKTIQGVRKFQAKYSLLDVKPVSESLSMPSYLNKKLFIEGLDMYLIGLTQPYFIAESTDKH